MKKSLFYMLLLFVFTLSACGGSTENESAENAENEEPDEVANEMHDDEEDEAKLPDITDETIEHAYDVINDYDMVKDSYVEVSKEDKSIILTIQVNAATNEEHAKELGDNFARALASGAGIYGEEEMESPSKDYLGEIYDYYDLRIGVGTDSGNFIVQGAKVTSSSKITW